MDEASSKYVDYIATEKLLTEKLQQVHHAPALVDDLQNLQFDDFSALSTLPSDLQEQQNGLEQDIRFTSAVRSGYPENDQVRCRVYPARQPLAAVLLIHGLFEDNLIIYKYYISQLVENGLQVFILFLPFHYSRKPKESVFSGELYWSGDLNRSALAYKQAVYDAYHLLKYIKNTVAKPILLNGFSMGGGVAWTLSSLVEVEALFVVNPVCNFSDLVWNRRLFSTIKSDLEQNGYILDKVTRQFAHFDPINCLPKANSIENVAVGYGIFDQISSTDNYQMLIDKWQVRRVLPYNAGHLNILRVPRLAQDAKDLILSRKHDELL
ncbi:MAG: hypothetical protein EHM72_01415 [Calditrichaeota bacterium]|nr:MAG: hypothetical protein EHM72_01415 [Calditrichota bacterium]